jgi:hypothetical protein
VRPAAAAEREALARAEIAELKAQRLRLRLATRERLSKRRLLVLVIFAAGFALGSLVGFTLGRTHVHVYMRTLGR